jgi:hypothetical protein
MDWTKAARGQRGFGGRAFARDRMARGLEGFRVSAMRKGGAMGKSRLGWVLVGGGGGRRSVEE